MTIEKGLSGLKALSVLLDECVLANDIIFEDKTTKRRTRYCGN